MNNCLNGQCNEIIDSRDSAKCSNGWRICIRCVSCCSHTAFERRLKNLDINGGKIYGYLSEMISIKAGHLEKAEYFCYKCGQLMTEYSQTLYKCTDCETQYDLSKYSQILKKQIHLDFRTNDYPTKLHEMIPQLKKILLEEKEMLIQQGRSEKQIFGILFNKQVAIDGVNISLKELNDKKLKNEIFQENVKILTTGYNQKNRENSVLVHDKPPKDIKVKRQFPSNIFDMEGTTSLESVILNAPIINGRKTSYKEIRTLLDSNSKLVSIVWKHFSDNNHPFMDGNSNHNLALLLINMAERRGYYFIK